MQNSTSTSSPIGFHYYPDTAHYTNKEFNEALVHLQKLGTNWLVLRSETSRAIPETFISGLLSSHIQPIIHFPLVLPNAPAAADLKAILSAYAKWGASYVILFDAPNDAASWSASGWSQANPVESFLDRFIPLANECLAAGLIPVFPALKPGGSYWDLSFFSLALQALKRRGQKTLLSKMALAAYACTYDHPLDWGKGGATQWPQNKPYMTPAQSQDQIGFNQAAWLEEIAIKVLGNSLPVILLGLGRKDLTATNIYAPQDHANIVRQIKGFLGSNDLPLIAGNYWLLSATANDENSALAWVKEDGSTLPAYEVLASGSAANPVQNTAHTLPDTAHAVQEATNGSKVAENSAHPIQHYLLLPKYEWGVSDWHLEASKPFILKHQPTVGFSINEARLAVKVTVVGGEQSFSEDALTQLRNAGCQVERISGDGTSIATQLAER
jgi:hypothetical protein